MSKVDWFLFALCWSLPVWCWVAKWWMDRGRSMTPDSDPGVAVTDHAPCGYQDVECWERQLRAAGWLPWDIRRKCVAHRGATTWKSPAGLFYRGPFGAWKAMKEQTQ